MLNRSASLAMSTSVLKALPGKLDIKRHSPSILYVFCIVKISISSLECSFSETDIERVISFLSYSHSLIMALLKR